MIGFRAVLDDFREETNVLTLPGGEQEVHDLSALCVLTIQAENF